MLLNNNLPPSMMQTGRREDEQPDKPEDMSIEEVVPIVDDILKEDDTVRQQMIE